MVTRNPDTSPRSAPSQPALPSPSPSPSRLHADLLEALQSPFAIKLTSSGDADFTGIDLSNNPRSSAGDPALLWKRNDDSNQEIVWIAMVMHGTSGDKPPPYYSLPPASMVIMFIFKM